jgi:tetratricopeptide (TPR) repeat protein
MRRIELSPQTDVRYCAVSPNGRWVATGSHWTDGGPSVKVWDAHTGKLEKALPVEVSSMVGFSPDDRWLATTGGGCRLWAVGSWEEGPRVGGIGFAFSPDAKILALEAGFGRVRLVDPDTGNEYARLEAPVQSRLYPQCFTPDSAQLITWAEDRRELHIWDLRAIRQQLADLGLDWDVEPYEPAKPAAPLEVRLDLRYAFEFLPGGDRTSIGLNSFVLALNPYNFEAYFQRGRAYDRLQGSQKAIADYSMALALMPLEQRSRGEALFRRSSNYNSRKDPSKEQADLQAFAELDLELPWELYRAAAERCNNLAWQYVKTREKQQDPKKALPLAQKAVKLTPDQWVYWNTLGVVYYRLGQYPEAIDKLDHSLRDSQGQAAAYNLFFLAMCHARNGESAKAEACYKRAVQWVQEQERQHSLRADWKEELQAFRAEAEALLPAQAEKPV